MVLIRSSLSSLIHSNQGADGMMRTLAKLGDPLRDFRREKRLLYGYAILLMECTWSAFLFVV